MRISDIMTADPVTIAPDEALDRAMDLMDEHDVRHVPIVDDGELIGVLSNRDVLGATGWLPSRVRDVYEGPEKSRSKTVRDILHSPAMTVSPDDTIVAVAVETSVQGIGCLPVVRDGALVGIVTETDLLRAYLKVCRKGEVSGDVDPPVRQWMTDEVKTAGNGTTVGEAALLFQTYGFHHLPVVENDLLTGMLSDRDVRRAVGCGRGEDHPIDGLVHREPVAVSSDERLSTAAALMVEHKISSVAVVDEDKLVGIVTVTDLLDHCINHLREPDGSRQTG